VRWALLLVTGLAFGCGRLNYDTTGEIAGDDATALDGPIGDDASTLGGLIFYVDAANVAGDGLGGAANCPGSASMVWNDLAGGAVGTLVNYVADEPPCAGRAGWDGSGDVGDPERLTLDVGNDNAVTFGAVAEATQFTVEAWILWTGNGVLRDTGGGGISLYPIVAKGTGEEEVTEQDANYFLGIAAGGQIATDFEDSIVHDNFPLSGSTVLSTGTWYHLAVTYDQNQQNLYVNGVLDGTANQTAPASPAVQSILAVGADYGYMGNPAGGYFDGDIAIVRIFDRGLSGAEVVAECQMYSSRFLGLVCP
jgi:hypothetical protein